MTLRTFAIAAAIAASAALGLAQLARADGTQLLPLPDGVIGAAGDILVGADTANAQGKKILFEVAANAGGFLLAANSCTEQAVPVTGLLTGDNVYVNKGTATGTGAIVVSARQEGTDYAAFTWCNVTASTVNIPVGAFSVDVVRL